MCVCVRFECNVCVLGVGWGIHEFLWGERGHFFLAI